DCAIAAVVCGVMTESRMCCQFSQAAAASDGTGVSSGEIEAEAPDAEVPAAAAAGNADPAASGGACSSGSKVGASIDDGSTTPSGEVVATAWAVCISRSSSSEASSAESATFSATQRDFASTGAAGSGATTEIASATSG